MLGFQYSNATRLFFGREAEKGLVGRLADDLGHEGDVLVVYGGGSVIRSGLLPRVTAALKDAGLTVHEEGGVVPNPQIGLVRTWIKKYAEKKPRAILAVGGGSVIDSAKAAAVGFEADGDVWDFFAGKAIVQSALPVYTILTLPAAGSEQSIRAVLSNEEGIKTGIGVEAIRPKASAVNPELFFTLPVWQIGAGVTDMISHIMERYFTNTEHCEYVDAQAEAAMRTAVDFGPKVVANPSDWDAWCQIAMVGTYAHNGYFGLGREEDWACHGIEHELSGWNAEVTHGAGLAVIIPSWMAFVAKTRPARVEDFALRVMRVEKGATQEETVARGIEALKAFYRTLGMPVTLAELKVPEAPIEKLAKGAVRKGLLGKYVPLDEAAVKTILENAR